MSNGVGYLSSTSLDDFFDEDNTSSQQNGVIDVHVKVNQVQRSTSECDDSRSASVSADEEDEGASDASSDTNVSEAESSRNSSTLNDIVIIEMEKEKPTKGKIPKVIQVYDPKDNYDSDNEYAVNDSNDEEEEEDETEKGDTIDDEVDNDKESETGTERRSEYSRGNVKDVSDLPIHYRDCNIGGSENEDEVCHRIEFTRAPSCRSLADYEYQAQHEIFVLCKDLSNQDKFDIDEGYQPQQIPTVPVISSHQNEDQANGENISRNREINTVSADEGDPSESSRSEKSSESDVDAENEDEEEVDELYEQEDENREVRVALEPDIPLEGALEATTPTESRLTRINTMLYSTDGEDLTDVHITRSYALKNRKEVVSAGAHTLGELMVSLKRKRAAEVRQQIQSPTDDVEVSVQLIQKRKEENEKLKFKHKRLCNSSVPENSTETSNIMASNDILYPVAGTSVNPSRRLRKESVAGDHADERIPTPDDSPTADERMSRLCSTELNITPTDRNTVSGALTTCSGVVSGSSDKSGRKNPQAKVDNELRSSGRPRVPPPLINSGLRQENKPVLPEIHRGNPGLPNKQAEKKDRIRPVARTNVHITKDSNTTSQTTPRRCHDVKPPIPHQLRSAVCYHDGKMDVSIIGDRGLLSNTNPLDVKITFVHKTSLPVSSVPVDKAATEKSVRNTQLPPLRLPKYSKEKSRRINKSSDVTSVRNGISKLQMTMSRKNAAITNISQIKKSLPPLRNAPQINRRNVSIKQKVKSKNNSKSKSARALDSLNWNIVAQRAQWPSFNTYTNQESSDRYNKMFQ